MTVSNTPTDLNFVNFPSSLQLTSTNYLGWKTQIEAPLQGLDLYKFVDGSYLPLSKTITFGTVTSPDKNTKNGSSKTVCYLGLLLAIYPLQSSMWSLMLKCCLKHGKP